MKLALMDQGRSLLKLSLSNGTKPRITSFTVGADSGFTPVPSASSVSPSSVYTGNIANIKKQIINENEVILTAVFPNTLALNKIGNIMLNFNTNVPFLWFVLSSAFGKLSINKITHFAGDLQFQSMIVRIPGIASLIDYTGIEDFHSQAKVFATLDSLPRPVLAGASEVFIENSNLKYNKNKPIYAVRALNEWWGVPNMKALDDVNFQYSIDGGVVGDGYGA